MEQETQGATEEVYIKNTNEFMSSPKYLTFIWRPELDQNQRHEIYEKNYPYKWVDVFGYVGLYEVSDELVYRTKVARGRYPKHHIVEPVGNRQIRLTDVNGKRNLHNFFILALRSFFPLKNHFEKPAGDNTSLTVDHIHEISLGGPKNHITNLFFCTRSQNTKKSNKVNPERYKKAAKTNSKSVFILNGKNGVKVRKYDSTHDAARSLNLHQASISKSAKSAGKISTKGHYFAYDSTNECNLPGEAWISSEYLDKMIGKIGTFASNRGRMQCINGRRTFGKKVKGQKYRTFEGVLVHRLIYAAFHNIELPDWKEEQVLHNDDAPLDAEGFYRNWLEDLELGSQVKI